MDLTSLETSAKYIGMGIAIGFGVMGPGLGIGLAAKALIESSARQPEVSGKLFTFFLVGAALAETCAIYAFIISMFIKG